MAHTNGEFSSQVRVMQIIAVALASGVMMFAIVVISLGALNMPSSGYAISFVGAIAAAASLIVAAVTNKVHDQSAQSLLRNDPDQEDAAFVGIYQTRLIIALAIREGVAFLNLIACFIEHNWWSLAITAALVLAMVSAFPTTDRVQQWIRQQREIVSLR